MEILRLCRICLKTNDLTQELKEHETVAIEKIFKIKIDSCVSPPYLACHDCKFTLMKFYKFYMKTLKNQKVFEKNFQEDWCKVNNSEVVKEILGEKLCHSESEEKSNTRRGNTTFKIEEVQEAQTWLNDDQSISDTEHLQSDICQDLTAKDAGNSSKVRRSRRPKLKPIKSSPDKTLDSNELSNQNLCTDCGKTFRSKVQLDRHTRRVHSNVSNSRQFFCDICPRMAKSKAEIKEHLERVHLKIRKFVCQVCGDKFLGSNNLKFHLTTHDDTRPRTQCPDCGVWVLDVKKHWKTSHNDTNPVICPHCGVTLMNKKKLGFHIYKHHAAPGKYRCNECQKDFKNALYLKEHLHQKHIGGFLYRCEWCEFQTNYSKNMPQHQKTKHKNEYEANRIAKLTANGPLPMSRLWQLKLEEQAEIKTN